MFKGILKDFKISKVRERWASAFRPRPTRPYNLHWWPLLRHVESLVFLCRHVCTFCAALCHVNSWFSSYFSRKKLGKTGLKMLKRPLPRGLDLMSNLDPEMFSTGHPDRCTAVWLSDVGLSHSLQRYTSGVMVGEADLSPYGEPLWWDHWDGTGISMCATGCATSMCSILVTFCF